MKSYKLIKEYPGSPKLRTIVERDSNCSNYYYRLIEGVSNTFTPKNIENNPEFWEEVVEKDYEILSYIGKSTKNVLSAKLDPFVNNKLIKWEDKNLDIHSIKRLSDGEVFTIGDKIQYNNTNNNIRIIKSIELDDIKVKIFACEECYSVPIKGSNYGFNLLQNVTKFKQPLFTTEDGVDIFEGDEYILVRKGAVSKNLCTFTYTAVSGESMWNSKQKDYTLFSTKEAAEEYILMNKPVLSINDLKACGDLTITELKKIVINKLK